MVTSLSPSRYSKSFLIDDSHIDFYLQKLKNKIDYEKLRNKTDYQEVNGPLINGSK